MNVFTDDENLPEKKCPPRGCSLQSSRCWETISGTPREIWKYGAAISRLSALPMLMQRWCSLIFHALIETLCELLFMGVAATFACWKTGKKPSFPLAPSQTIFCRFLITEALNKLNNTGGGDQRSLSLAPKLILERSAHNRFADLRMYVQTRVTLRSFGAPITNNNTDSVGNAFLMCCRRSE